MLTPPGVPNGVVAYWSFDEKEPIYNGGLGLHAIGDNFAGPPVGHKGASTRFADNHFLTVPHNSLMDTRTFSYSGWVFLEKTVDATCDGDHTWCPILRKGVADKETKQMANGPAFLFDKCGGKFKIFLSTEKNPGEGEFLLSNARLKHHQWTHFGIVRIKAEKRTRLYINGILDSTMQTEGIAMLNNLPLYVGGDPYNSCGVNFLIDELKFFNRALTPGEVAAEAAPALGGVDPSFVQLACLNCPLDEASSACTKGYHVCSSLELHMSAYQVARSMGWLYKGRQVWTHAATHEKSTDKAALVPQNATQFLSVRRHETDGPDKKSKDEKKDKKSSTGLGLCCMDAM